MGKPLTYEPGLDGLRAVAVLAVLFFHAKVPGMEWGFLGVDVFFVLSGYLITRILMERRDSLISFYIKRAARLYPALLLMLAAYVAVTGNWLDSLAAALYLTDYTAALSRWPADLIHTWSLSVEEHFYLLWPLILTFVARSKNPARVLLTAWLIVTLWRAANFQWLGWDAAYFRFDTRCSGILIGTAVAHGLKVPKVSALAFIPAILLAPGKDLDSAMVAMPLAELSAAALIVSPPRLLGSLSYLGTLSYGIYLWHLPIMRLAPVPSDPAWMIIVGGGLAVVMAAVSYHTIESPIRRMARSRFKPATSQ